MNDKKFIIKIEKNYFQVYDEMEDYTEPKSSYSATVNAIVSLPFVPFFGLELGGYGKITQINYSLKDDEFHIKVEKSNISARTHAQLTEFNISDNFEGFVDDIAQWWDSAILSVYGYGGSSQRFLIKSGVASPL